MSVSELPYQGDDVLVGLLKKSGVRADMAQIRGILAGVLAAPVGERSEDWIELVAPGADPSCQAQLAALKRRLADESRQPRLSGSADRVAALRYELSRRQLAGFLVPRADEHQGEYVPPRAERLAWLSGFTGSAGLAIVLADRAAVFVDGRYTLQLRDQVDLSLFEPRHLIEEPP